jgi:hypothetical protein
LWKKELSNAALKTSDKEFDQSFFDAVKIDDFEKLEFYTFSTKTMNFLTAL